MDHIRDDLELTDISPHDSLQVELKSDFFPHAQAKSNTYIQEFYVFIPNTLQINADTYVKDQFYRDITNFIRYKTPLFTLSELSDTDNIRSPLSRLEQLAAHWRTSIPVVEDELKLFVNIVRSSVRDTVKSLLEQLDQTPLTTHATLQAFCDQIERLQKRFRFVSSKFEGCDTHLNKEFQYADNFFSNILNHYLCLLLDHIRLQVASQFEDLDARLSSILIEEQQIRCCNYEEPSQIDRASSNSKETLSYRNSLLNKFVLDALQLKIKRSSVDETYRNWIGALAAGIAMLVYASLFAYFGNVFVWDSLPFLLITVSLYILKDRIKEALKGNYFRRLFYWYPDYKTELWSPNEKHLLGYIREWFGFLKEKSLPSEIAALRNQKFHAVLEEYKRPEQILYYKRVVQVPYNPAATKSRRFGLNSIFRLNIHTFLRKASDPTAAFITIDPDTKRLVGTSLPKVYHLNIILKTTRLSPGFENSSELHKLRLVIDKTGIKRIEPIEVL